MHEKLNKERLGEVVLNVYKMWKTTGDKKVVSAIKNNVNSESQELELQFVFDLLTKNLDDMITIWENDGERTFNEYESIMNRLMEMEDVSNIEELTKKFAKFRAENLHQPSNLSQEEEEELDRKLEARLKELKIND